MKILKNIKIKYYKVPMWVQVFSIATAISIVLVTILMVQEYLEIRGQLIEHRLDSLQKLVSAETLNLETYIGDLSDYSVQGCYDNNFLKAIEDKKSPTDTDLNYLKEQIKIYFYSRSDINEYTLYLINPGLKFVKNMKDKQILQADSSDIRNEMFFRECTGNTGYQYISTDVDSRNNSLFKYYHSILNIKTREPMAITEVLVDDTFWKDLLKNHDVKSEILCLVTNDGQLIKSTQEEMILRSPKKELDNLINGVATKSKINIQGKRYFIVKDSTNKNGLTFMVLTPVSSMTAELKSAFTKTIFIGLLFIILSLIAIICFARYLTRPLTELSKNMELVGKGDFSVKDNSAGSLEVELLSTSFNEMTDKIQELIKSNYVYKINEKSAQIVALEAQLNPHYLYNTLQAIATEALMNDQKQIYKMINALASGLRYSIKGEGMVPLEKEMEYVKNYIYLQKLRMEDKLETNIHVDDGAWQVHIPKISIQLLVENAIIHGIGNNKDSISINIDCHIDYNRLTISVRDDGEGFDPEELKALQEKLLYNRPDSESIGLMNLASRLKIMYNERAFLFVDSVKNKYTEVKIDIPI